MIQRVFFEVCGERVVGHLHSPTGEPPYPAVVVAGPMTSVKEQVTGVYASALAQRGIASLALDHRHFGESDGTPRQYEYYVHKIEDLQAGLSWLASQDNVCNSRLGAAGVCLGVGYAVWAAVDNPLVKAVGGVAGYYRDPDAMRLADPVAFQTKIEGGISARIHYQTTRETLMIPAVSRNGEAAMTTEDTFDYYGTPRAGVPNYKNAFAIMSREHFLLFNVQAAAQRIRVPMTMIHSENALSPLWARNFFAALKVPKHDLWLTSKGQTDFYDVPELVNTASDALAEHFHKYL
jgi:uncharacterized protein